MRYFELWREKFTNKIVKIMDLSAKEYNSRKVDMEVYLKKHGADPDGKRVSAP